MSKRRNSSPLQPPTQSPAPGGTGVFRPTPLCAVEARPDPAALPNVHQLASEIRAAPVVLPTGFKAALPVWEYQETSCYADELAAHAAAQGAAGWRMAWGREDKRQATRNGIHAQWRTCVLLWERPALPDAAPLA